MDALRTILQPWFIGLIFTASFLLGVIFWRRTLRTLPKKHHAKQRARIVVVGGGISAGLLFVAALAAALSDYGSPWAALLSLGAGVSFLGATISIVRELDSRKSES